MPAGGGAFILLKDTKKNGEKKGARGGFCQI